MKPNKGHYWKPTTRQRQRQVLNLSRSHIHPSIPPSLHPFVHFTASPALRVAGVEVRLQPSTSQRFIVQPRRSSPSCRRTHSSTPARPISPVCESPQALARVSGSSDNLLFVAVLGWSSRSSISVWRWSSISPGWNR